MRITDIIAEGGWDTKITQDTVISPQIVRATLAIVSGKFIRDFNQFLDSRGVPPIKMGHPTGSSAYYEVDKEDKIYGDIDLQIIVPEIPETAGKTMSQQQTIWNKLEDEFVKTVNPQYVSSESEPGHPIIDIGNNAFVQVDLMPHVEKLATWGRFRTTPERGIKGLLNGNMFSVLGEMLMMSIQHSGVQFKVRDKKKLPYTPTRKNYELVTLSTDIENFVMDIFRHEAHEQGITKGKIDPLLKMNPGSKLDDVKIANLVNAVKGLALSFGHNNMYGNGDLENYSSAEDFLAKFWTVYEGKAMKDINAPKRDKAETPQAIARAEDDRQKIQQGLDYVRKLFQS
jgi:hypothetical protein